MTKRAATWILTAIGRHKWGMVAVIMPSIVDHLGPAGALLWIARNMPEYERALVELGPLRANFLCCVASILNGCAYCTYAHGRAFELHFFAERGELFPLDEQELVSLASLSDDEVAQRLGAALEEASLREEMTLYRRLYALKLGGAEPGPGDRYLVHAIKMFDVLNRCAIESRVAIDEAHDGINKDDALKARYAEARLRARPG